MNWMDDVAQAAEARLGEAGVRLTLGGEPTYVPIRPEGAEWNFCADGPTKLPIARRLAEDLQRRVWPGSTLLYCPGKCYEGEVNPRWALRLITGTGGTPPVHWPGPCQPGLQGGKLKAGGALAWLDRLAAKLGVPLHPLALRDPLAPDRQVWASPLSAEFGEPDGPEPAFRWITAPWPLEPALRELSRAPGPAGLRLPLEHFPQDVVRQVFTLEIDPDGWEIFLPPLQREPLQRLLQAIADSLEGLAAPRLSGVLPIDCDGHWQVMGLTADPGVLEINLPVCHSWREYRGWLEQLEQAGHRLGLRGFKEVTPGKQEGTGGGNHLLFGGPSLSEHPFFSRPAWLVGMLRFWQHHPVLAYLFSGSCVGPASQAPRPDEAAGESFDLELAYRMLETAESSARLGAFGDYRELIGETLRHLHADRSGNNHRSEISFDKFWNPGTPAGCLGLIEFRALESMPRVEWTNAIALLWYALAAYLLKPGHRPRALRDWSSSLHDRMLLPSQLWEDLERILALLEADGLKLDPAPFREIWEWRFPPQLQWQEGPHRLELRPALEPWPLICDFPREGGFTSRFIDGSLRRFEVIANHSFRLHCQLLLNDRPLPLPSGLDNDSEPLLAVRYRHHRLYPCLHPAIDPHLPLRLVILSDGREHHFMLSEESDTDTFQAVETEPGASRSQQYLEGSAWQGRQKSSDVTLDLRL